MTAPRALILEPSGSVAQVLRGFLSPAGFEVTLLRAESEVKAALSAQGGGVLFVSATGALDGEALCKRQKQEWPEVPVVLIYPPEETSAETRSSGAGADACLVGPLKQGSVVSLAKLLLRLAALPRPEVGAPAESGRKAFPAGAVELEFFHRILELEVKRSRRYAYPVALLALGLDAPADTGQGASAGAAVERDAQDQMAHGIRDTDFVVQAPEGHFLLLLPYTSLGGANGVAERLRSRLFGLQGTFMTATAGVAAMEPSIAATQNADKLIRAATAALHRAQAAGGDRTEQAPLV